jgi:hypothetical protein
MPANIFEVSTQSISTRLVIQRWHGRVARLHPRANVSICVAPLMSSPIGSLRRRRLYLCCSHAVLGGLNPLLYPRSRYVLKHICLYLYILAPISKLLYMALLAYPTAPRQLLGETITCSLKSNAHALLPISFCFGLHRLEPSQKAYKFI